MLANGRENIAGMMLCALSAPAIAQARPATHSGRIGLVASPNGQSASANKGTAACFIEYYVQFVQFLTGMVADLPIMDDPAAHKARPGIGLVMAVHQTCQTVTARFT
jgi:hypothetical protein